MRRRRLLRIAVILPAACLLALGSWLGGAAAVYSPAYVWRVLRWRDSDVGDYLHHFPHRELADSLDPYYFEEAHHEARVEEVFETILDTDDLASFLAENDSQSFIVIKNDRVIYERYFNGWRRDSMVTSFSVAKSFVSTLVGIAIDEGYIASVDDPITAYLPELAERDERFGRITIRHLLTMSSGLGYHADGWYLFNGDDPLTTYYPDQREISLTNIGIEEAPGQRFRYNKYHPQLLGMILERATGMSVTEWTQTRLWSRIGMEFDGAWCLDSNESGFEKMEAGINARAIDFAKLGRLFLQGGRWNGEQVVSESWVETATGTDPAGQAPAFADDSFYGYMWWGVPRSGHPPDFIAEGDHGQYIYVSPANDLIIVRTGTEYGIEPAGWVDAFSRAAAEL
ncbi:MAG: serine hydrolase [Thermomicrobiales bacterium]